MLAFYFAERSGFRATRRTAAGSPGRVSSRSERGRGSTRAEARGATENMFGVTGCTKVVQPRAASTLQALLFFLKKNHLKYLKPHLSEEEELTAGWSVPKRWVVQSS